MKFIITKTELIFNEGIEQSATIIRDHVRVNNIEEYRILLSQRHGCSRILFVYKEKKQ